MNREEQEAQLSRDFKEAFGTEGGLRVWEKLKSLSTFNKSGISPDKHKTIDPNRLIYDEGQRAMLLYIDKQIKKDLKGK